jgi:hypothetical protein
MAEKNNALNEESVVASIGNFYKNAPHLPANIREVLVKIAPWAALVFGILSVLGGLGLVVGPKDPVFGVMYNSTYFMVNGILTIIVGVLLLMAFPKLQKQQYSGWRLLFWAEVVSIVSSLTGILAGSVVGSLVGALIGALIGFYILFEIKSSYK